MKIVWLEPFYGGSHRAIADNFAQYSSFEVELITLPARHWKWRLRGSAFYFAEMLEKRAAEIGGSPGADLLLCSSLCDLSLLRSLIRSIAGVRDIPLVQYIHEHQFSYPMRSGLTPDANYPLTDLSSTLAADAVRFNSRWCMESFMTGARSLLSRMPDHRCSRIVDRVERRSAVLYPGCSAPRVGERSDTGEQDSDRRGGVEAGSGRSAGPTILWNHRWEYDKAPEVFFRALERIDRPELGWRVIVTGGRFRRSSGSFGEALKRLRSRVLHEGFVEERGRYDELVRSCDIVVSTAIQENFGLSVMEAMGAGVLPVLPRRLSYPELYGDSVARYYGDGVMSDGVMGDGDSTDETSMSAASRSGDRGPGDRAKESEVDHLAAALEELCEEYARDAAVFSPRAREQRARAAEYYSWAERAIAWDRTLSSLVSGPQAVS